MKNVQRYSDKFIQKPLLRNASEERKNLITNREKYIQYLENQIEEISKKYLSNQNQENRISQIQNTLNEHEDKFINIIKLIKLLQSFAESQETENTQIKQLLNKELGFIQDNEIAAIQEKLKLMELQFNKYNSCLQELQFSQEDAEKFKSQLEMKNQEFIQQIQHNLLDDIRVLQNQNNDYTQIERGLNMKIEVIMNELRNTALYKDVQSLEYRIKILEGNNANHSKSLVSNNEQEELKMILKGVMTDLKQMKESFHQVTPAVKNELNTLKTDISQCEKRMQKKVVAVIDKLNNMMQPSPIVPQKQSYQESDISKEYFVPKTKRQTSDETNQSIPQKEKKVKKKKSASTQRRSESSRKQGPEKKQGPQKK